MTIITQGALPPSPALTLLDDIAKQCNDQENTKEANRGRKKKRTCQKLGQDKHKCCEEKIQDHRKKNPENGDPPIEGERCYNRPKFDSNGQPVQPVDTTPLNTDRGQTISNAIKSCGKKPSRKQVRAAIGKALAGKVFPDAAILGPNGEKTFVDFKFACPESHRSKKKSTKKKYRPPKQSPDQQAAHDALGQATGGGKSATILF